MLEGVQTSEWLRACVDGMSVAIGSRHTSKEEINCCWRE